MTIPAEGAAWFASAAGFALAMAATPGPNNAMIAASGANFGMRRSLPHLLGVTLGFPTMLLLVALGAAELLHATPGLERALRWGGAAWMLWLAWRIATAEPAGGAAEAGRAGGGTRTRPLSFLEAAAFQWVNPKAWTIAAGAIAAYTAGGGALLPRALLLAAIFAVATLLSLVAWAALGAGMARLLLRASALRRFNRVMALLLALSVLPLLAG